MNGFQSKILLFIFLIFSSQTVFGQEWKLPERRPETGSKDFGWFFAPTPIRIEGVGQAVPVFGLVSNLYETTDLIYVQTLPGGDFDIGVTMFKDLPVFTEHFIVSAGQFKQEISSQLYNRGIDSDPEDYIVPFSKQNGNFYMSKLLFWEERIELFYQRFTGDSEIQKIFDKDGNLLSAVSSKSSFDGQEYGFVFDFTDDAIDPREGVRYGHKLIPNNASNVARSDTLVTDQDLTLYFPMRKDDTLVFNFYRSTSKIVRSGITDDATARAMYSQNCDSSSAYYAACQAGEDKLVNDFLAYNRYGQAASLGGANRMRGYAAGRFNAGNSASQAVEYRYNLSSDKKEVNWYLLGGVESLLQLAFFAERGTVAEYSSQLNSNIKSNYGAGFRALISGFIYRLDVAVGSEGPGVTMFIQYPLELNPI